MGIRRANFRSSGRPRRPMDWYCGNFDGITVEGVPECAWAILPSELHEETTDPTLMASRVALRNNPVTAPANNAAIAAFGIIAWNYVDDTVPTMCPDPLANCDFDWVWWHGSPRVVNDASPEGNGGSDTQILSKARRRLGNDQSLLFVVSSVGQPWNFHLHARFLIKE